MVPFFISPYFSQFLPPMDEKLVYHPGFPKVTDNNLI